jgi:flagellar hook-associated protein 1
MSLFGSIQMAGNTLQAMQIGLHVVGNNIANANTPGYIRERTIYTPAPVMRMGGLAVGLGVEIAGIVQNVDRFVEDRLRDVGSDRASADIQQNVYRELESILGELSDTDVSSSLTSFFNSIGEIIKQPEEMSLRNLTVQSGKSLATTVNTLARRVDTVYKDFGQVVKNLTSEVNTLTEQISKLNLQIVALEGGSAKATEAGALRSQRNTAIKRLAEIMDVKVTETSTGATNIAVGGELIISEGTRRSVKTNFGAEANGITATIAFTDNGDDLRVAGGELHGVYTARDEIVGGFIDKLDKFAASLIFEFNKVFSQGQGATGFSSISSQNEVNDPGAPLDAAGLAFTPVNGQFELQVRNTATGLTERHSILVDLNGLDGDMTLASLATQLDAISGVNAQVTADNLLKISASSGETQLAFGGDTSGLLAALGINTFFTGTDASSLGINEVVAADGSKFAAALDGIGVGTENALKLVSLHDTGLASLSGNSITGMYDQLINETAQGSTVAASIADGFAVFEQTLQANSQAVSGVNLDEEAIDMILLQRTYQASARYISTLTELMDILVSL